MATSRSQVEVLLKLNDQMSAKLKRSLGTIDKQAKTTKRTFTTMAAGMRASWLAISAAMAGVIIVGRQMINDAVEYESAFAGVRKTVDATEEEFKQLSEQIRSMALRIPVAAKELANIQEIAGQLGVRGVENLTKFTEVVAKIAVTTNLTREAAATNFARIANVMQEPLTNVDKMGSAVVDLGNNFATTEAEITEFAKRIAGAGRVAGLSTADIFAFGAAFSAVGVRAERGGTAVSKALIMMGDAVTQGGSSLKRFAEISGMTSQEFITAYHDNAGKAFALFIEGLGKQGLKGAKILKELQLGDQRLVQAFLSVGGASGILTNALAMSNDAFIENNALTLEAAKRFETAASHMILFKNAVADLNIELGVALLPIITKVTVVLSEMIRIMREGGILAFEPFKGMIEGVTAAGIASEEALMPIRGMSSALSDLKANLEASMAAGGAKDPSKFFQDFNKAASSAFKSISSAGKLMAVGFVQSTNIIGAGFGSAFGQMITEGKKFSAAMKEAFKNMAMQFIQLVTQMMIKWLAFMALKAMTGGAFPLPIPGMAAGGTVARGGSVLVGERGAEVLNLPKGASVTPLTQNDNSSTVNINMEGVSLSSQEDTEDALFRISNLIEARTRSSI